MTTRFCGFAAIEETYVAWRLAAAFWVEGEGAGKR